MATQKHKNQKVIITVSNDLVVDQRVDKTARCFVEMGYSVLLLGRKRKTSEVLQERSYSCKRLRLGFDKGPLFYAALNIRLFLSLLFRPSHIIFANDLDTLPAAYFASLLKRKPLIYDSHEYFTQVPELVDRPQVQKIWQSIESFLLPKVKYSLTVCQSIAQEYKGLYGIDMKVMRNVPDTKAQPGNSILKEQPPVILYQGAVNKGRGLATLIAAMKWITNAQVWIIGAGDVREGLEKMTKQLNLDDRVKFLGRIPFEQLFTYTQQASIGVSIEENIGLNYYYALPNKLFDYIQAGIPVLGSKLPEIERIIKDYEIGTFIDRHDPEHLAHKINEMLQDEEQLKSWKQNAEKAASDLTWQHEKQVLIELVKQLPE
jgi:glycosyltransferase involved in cell wall biosynthesis